MNCFICLFNDVYIGLPAEAVERFIIPSASEAARDSLSLTAFFRSHQPAPHGAVLKRPRRLLLVPRIEADRVIEKIYPLPKPLRERLPFLGASFAEATPILLLDTEKLFFLAEARRD